ncbi:hypothetical protein H0H92_005723 [Tricholoma furcatifolium]|nr:hypothetical protein H0H92_005723 [Tricholoma furcatifolium]
MADSSHLFSSPPHPVQKGMRFDLAGPATIITSRTDKPVKYYFVDFRCSEKFSCKEKASRKVPWGSNKTVPEWHSPENTTHCNPFPVDVYCMGHYISSHFVDDLKDVNNPQKGFEFMRELVDDMMNKDPQKRPTMEQVVAQFAAIQVSRPFSKLEPEKTLCSAVVEIPSMIRNPLPKQDVTPVRARNNIAHWAKKRLNKWLGIPMMPSRVVTSDSLPPPRVGHVAFHAPKVALPWYCSQDTFPGQLGEPIEVLWREHYTYIEDKGYTLPPRYRPGAWLKEGEDRMPSTHGAVIHATCHDNTQPRMLKLVCNPHVHQDRNSVRPGVGEYGVGQAIFHKKFSYHPRNHCVPIRYIGVVSTDRYYPNEREFRHSTCDLGFMVMPYLQPIDNTLFTTIGGVVEYFHQIFEGLKFMHDQNVVHGDIKSGHIMVDSRLSTLEPIKYYFIDFQLSEEFFSKADAQREVPWGSNKTVPEHSQENTSCNPFPVDVYCMGHYIRSHFLDVSEGADAHKKDLEFMRELVDDMMNVVPQKRPTMEVVVARFKVISEGLKKKKKKLRSQLRLGSKTPSKV